MTNAEEEALGIKVYTDGRVGGRRPRCHGIIRRDENLTECDRRAIYVVEGRSKYKCPNGHRWPRQEDA